MISTYTTKGVEAMGLESFNALSHTNNVIVCCFGIYKVTAIDILFK